MHILSYGKIRLEEPEATDKMWDLRCFALKSFMLKHKDLMEEKLFGCNWELIMSGQDVEEEEEEVEEEEEEEQVLDSPTKDDE